MRRLFSSQAGLNSAKAQVMQSHHGHTIKDPYNRIRYDKER